MTNLETLLVKTSRTFALSIGLLPSAARREVTIAYLLFRIAATLEDGTLWPPAECAQALDDFAAVVERRQSADLPRLARGWVERPPVFHEGYRELLGASPSVVEHL